jgi:geranylgeranyl diphosphate synthase type II
MSFDKQYESYKNLFEEFLSESAREWERNLAPYYTEQLHQNNFFKQSISVQADFSFNYTTKIKSFLEAIKYSLMGEGKRFRPVIALATAELCDHDPQEILPFALSIEMIHTYSLIHDDLPCMDNDDFRRGRPTNHKVYGESTALLAGDALLTEAFQVLILSDSLPENKLSAISLLAECAGLRGMIGGQYFDLESQKNKVRVEELAQMQMNKTGALIYASMMGAALLCSAPERKKDEIKKYARLLGLSFQIADDILDQEKNELGSFVSLLGLEKSKDLLKDLTRQMFKTLEGFPKSDFFAGLARYNSERLK